MIELMRHCWLAAALGAVLVTAVAVVAATVRCRTALAAPERNRHSRPEDRS